MSEGGGENRWLTPQVLFAVLGMLGAISGAWLSFESRIARVEQANVFLTTQLERIDSKLDRIIEQRVAPQNRTP